MACVAQTEPSIPPSEIASGGGVLPGGEVTVLKPLKSRLALAGVFLLLVGLGAGWALAGASRPSGGSGCPPSCEPTAGVDRTPPPTATVVESSARETVAVSATPLPPTPSPEPMRPACRIPVLEYHDTEYNMSDGQVMMTTPWFLEQMQWLADNGFTTLTADQFLAFVDGTHPPPERSVLLTFDIGTDRADDYQNVIIPTLRSHGFRAVFFVLTQAITEDGAGNTLSWPRLRQWRDEGLISIQSHGVYHPDYTQLSFGQMLWDAKTSYDIILQQTGAAPTLFTFPFDSIPDNPGLVMLRAGYQAAMGGYRLERSVTFMDAERYGLPRYYPYSNITDYPILVGAERWTFGEMLLAAIGAQTGPMATPASTPTAAGPTAPAAYLDPLLTYCRNTGNRAGPDIDTVAVFQTDVSQHAQGLLASPVLVRPTCRYGPAITPEAVVLHFTSGSYEAALDSFRNASGLSSIHYLVDRDGTITQVVPEILGAYHVTCYGNRGLCLPDCPVCQDAEGHLTEPWTRTLGIEIVNTGHLRGQPGDFRYSDGSPFDGLIFVDYLASWRYRYWEDYPEEQVAALRILVEDILERWGIPLELVLGHSRIQTNKVDPGPALNLTWTRYGDPCRPPIFSPGAGSFNPGVCPATPSPVTPGP